MATGSSPAVRIRESKSLTFERPIMRLTASKVKTHRSQLFAGTLTRRRCLRVHLTMARSSSGEHKATESKACFIRLTTHTNR